MEITNIQNGVDDLSLAAGEYVFVDPCYIFAEPLFQWSDLCSQIFCTEGDTSSGTYSVEGQKVLWGQTRYGDGAYPMGNGGRGVVSVDAGLICIVPRSLYDLIVKGDEVARLAQHIGRLNLANDARICVQDGDWHIGCETVLSTSDEEEVCPYCGNKWCEGECEEEEEEEEDDWGREAEKSLMDGDDDDEEEE